MKSSQSKRKSLQKGTSGNQQNPVLTTVHQFANWLDQNLDNMLHENRDWQTVSGNLQYFDRQSREDDS